MTWRADGPQGNETGKVLLDLVHYLNGSVLDLGCGASKISHHAIGVDNCIDTQLFGTRIEPDVQVDTVERLAMFGDAAWDCVFSSHTLEHIVDYRSALAEFWRVVKPGGVLVLYLPHKAFYPNIGQPGANPDHKHDFVPADIVSAMRAVDRGWDLEVNEERNGGDEYSFLQVYRKTGTAAPTESWRAPRPAKTCAIVRLGAYGDAIMTSSILPALKAEGYHITVYVDRKGAEILKSDPHVDAIRAQPPEFFKEGAGLITYWLHIERKYDRFINLCGCVEKRLLPSPVDQEFYLPQAQRHRLMDDNYLETLHRCAGVPFDPQTVTQRFYPTAAETAWAQAERRRIDRPVVVINPAGSTAPKWWPHTQRLLDLLNEQGLAGVVLGDLRRQTFAGGAHGRVVGAAWTVRQALTFAQLADAVVGTESAIVNAVASEPMLKIVLLSHSSPHNLTEHWVETLAFEPKVGCFPCHRLHQHGLRHCNQDAATQAAACQAAVSADLVMAEIAKYLARKAEAERKAA